MPDTIWPMTSVEPRLREMADKSTTFGHYERQVVLEAADALAARDRWIDGLREFQAHPEMKTTAEHWQLVVDPTVEKDGRRIQPAGQCGGGIYMCGGTGYLHIKIACPACMAFAALESPDE